MLLADDYDRIFAWLAGPNFAPALRDSLDKAIDGTGQWFLKSTPYCDWVSGDTNVLWCKGPSMYLLGHATVTGASDEDRWYWQNRPHVSHKQSTDDTQD